LYIHIEHNRPTDSDTHRQQQLWQTLFH